MTDRVTIYEVSPRDGLQNEARLDPDRRQDRARRPADRLRLHPDRGGELRQPEMGAADGRRRRGARRHRPRARACATPRWRRTCKGYEAARAAGADEVAIFASASESFSRRNINALDRREPRALRPGRRGGARRRDAAARLCLLRHRLPVRGPDRARGGGRGGRAAVRARLPRGLARRHHRPRHARGGRRACCEAVLDVAPPDRLAGHFHDTARPRARQCRGGARLRACGSSTPSCGGLGGCPYAPGAAGNVATERVAARLAERGFCDRPRPRPRWPRPRPSRGRCARGDDGRIGGNPPMPPRLGPAKVART